VRNPERWFRSLAPGFHQRAGRDARSAEGGAPGACQTQIEMSPSGPSARQPGGSRSRCEKRRRRAVLLDHESADGWLRLRPLLKHRVGPPGGRSA
jgi:hypothetical protein